MGLLFPSRWVTAPGCVLVLLFSTEPAATPSIQNPSLKPFTVGLSAASFRWKDGVPSVQGGYQGSSYSLTGNAYGVYWCQDGASFAYADSVELVGDFTFTARIQAAQIPEAGVSQVGIMVRGRLGHMEPVLALRWDSHWAKATGSGLTWFNRITPKHSQVGGSNAGVKGCHGAPGQGCLGRGFENRIAGYPNLEGVWLRIRRTRQPDGSSRYQLFSRPSETAEWVEHDAVPGDNNPCANTSTYQFIPNYPLGNFQIPEDQNGKVMVGLYVANNASGKEKVHATFDHISITGKGVTPPPQPLDPGFSDKAQWWPSYFGPKGNWTLADEPHVQLVDKIRDARLLWKSEEFIPPASAQSKRKGLQNHGYKKGGGASVIVADNKACVYYQKPIPESDYWAATGNDIVHCVDAVTGKTLWKKTVGTSAYYDPKFDAKSRMIVNHTPCYLDGNIYSVANNGRLDCLNATSGEILWSTNIQGRAQTSALVPIDGMIVTGIGGRRGGTASVGMVAVDAKSGEVKWRCETCISGGATPTPWIVDGKGYIIAVNQDGEARCLEARTGKEMWTITGMGYNEATIHVNGDHMVAFVGKFTHKIGSSLAGYRITPQKATKLWTSDASDTLKIRMVNAIYKGHVYAFNELRRLSVFHLETGKLVGGTPLTKSELGIHYAGFGGSTPVVAVNNRLILNVDSEHKDHFVMHKTFPEGFAVTDSAAWWPYHELTTSYSECQATMRQPVVEGRFFTRGVDGIYCYDLRRLTSNSNGTSIHAPRSLRISPLRKSVFDAGFDYLGRILRWR